MATQLDNLDAHDGWQPSKGHAGAALFPALVALADAGAALSGRDALAALVSFVIAFAAAVPFMHTEVFVGFAADRLHGADVAYFVNFLVAVALYGGYLGASRLGRLG